MDYDQERDLPRFLAYLERTDSKTYKKVVALIERFCNHGKINNKEKCNFLGDGLWELKPQPARVPFFYHADSNCTYVMTHGFLKKKDIEVGEVAMARKRKQEGEKLPIPD